MQRVILSLITLLFVFRPGYSQEDLRKEAHYGWLQPEVMEDENKMFVLRLLVALGDSVHPSFSEDLASIIARSTDLLPVNDRARVLKVRSRLSGKDYTHQEVVVRMYGAASLIGQGVMIDIAQNEMVKAGIGNQFFDLRSVEVSRKSGDRKGRKKFSRVAIERDVKEAVDSHRARESLAARLADDRKEKVAKESSKEGSIPEQEQPPKPPLFAARLNRNRNATGEWKIYYGNGKLALKGSYDDGVKTGTWLLFSPDGELLHGWSF